MLRKYSVGVVVGKSMNSGKKFSCDGELEVKFKSYSKELFDTDPDNDTDTDNEHTEKSFVESKYAINPFLLLLVLELSS